MQLDGCGALDTTGTPGSLGDSGLGKVMVAMSGGVDSSVAAKLVCDAGYEAAGVTMRLFDGEGMAGLDADSEVGCCSLDDVQDAKQVCRRLGIPHHTFNYCARFRSQVIDRFCDGYLSGCTPNPCIDCNRYLKFEALQQRRRELGFDYVSTGHYVRREFCAETGRFALRRACDTSKDQSYVLANVTQDQLAHMLFPLGDLDKATVRAVAEQAGFATAEKAESQDICFVADGDYVGFIERQRGSCCDVGDIVDTQGVVRGRHAGLLRYTIGQRKGIGIAASEPYYVIGKNVEKNQLIIGFSDELLSRTVTACDVNYVAVPHFDGAVRVMCKTSYRQEPQPAIAEVTGDMLRVVFDKPQRACAYGQAVVLYDEEGLVLAGAVACAG
ncbi:tRNA 2-thiouridine(34) synthase MnmA [Adlercreutzia sp. ZJ138]|uniref:tRNA 2-thiouridine(34) synthase MnmA n=1 Tax=Adlercreutzia sp. ZJ138 TaxID=2709405 RepID=UPI001981673C|nr:tRNA 2-thiouridine(34) synthase MnmA [Adlercreutzia sp. ZJ138]